MISAIVPACVIVTGDKVFTNNTWGVVTDIRLHAATEKRTVIMVISSPGAADRTVECSTSLGIRKAI